MPRPKGALNKRTLDRRAEAARLEMLRRDDEARRMGVDTIPEKPVVQGVEGLQKSTMLAENMVAFLQPKGAWSRDEKGNLINGNPFFDLREFRYWHAIFMTSSDKLAAYQTPKLAAVAIGEHRRVEIVVTGLLPPREEEEPRKVIDITPSKEQAA
jgi:hypothetical protein